MSKEPRAKAAYTRRDSTATLSTPTRDITVHAKLTHDGVIVLGIYRNGEEIAHRELSPTVNYQD